MNFSSPYFDDETISSFIHTEFTLDNNFLECLFLYKQFYC